MSAVEENEFPFLSAGELRRAIAEKKVSPVEVVELALGRLEATESKINAFAHVTADLALAAARRAEKAVMSGEPLGLLHGLPISVKDLLPVAEVPCEFGSRTMQGNTPIEDAPAVERVKAHGACIIGKTTTSEFGCKAVGDSPLTGVTRNPWNLGKTPGGSSSGAAASVAAGVTPLALATDGGGSIRIPSSFSGVFGIKAQFGRVPVYPPTAAPTLSHVGPIARTVRDAALLLMAVSGFDARDPFSVAGPVPNFLADCDRPAKGMRIAWSPTLGYAKPSPDIVNICREAVLALEASGCHVELVEDVMTDPEQIWSSEFFAGAGTRLSEVLETNPGLLDPAVAQILASSLARPLRDYYSDVVRRYQFREHMRRFFDRYDLLATPTLPVAAFDVGRNLPTGHEGRNIVNWVYYTYPFNLTGQPAASVPVGFTSDDLPVGLQLIARTHAEGDIFCVASTLESVRPWNKKRISSI